MHKLSIFSIILAVMVVTVVLELVRNDYLTNYHQASYVGFGVEEKSDQEVKPEAGEVAGDERTSAEDESNTADNQESSDEELGNETGNTGNEEAVTKTGEISSENEVITTVPDGIASDVPAAGETVPPSEESASAPAAAADKAAFDSSDLLILSNVSEDMLVSSGFVDATLDNVDFNQMIFQIIEVPLGNEEQMLKFNVFQGNQFAISIYESLFGNADLAENFYNYSKTQGSKLSDMVVNVTDSFGLNSFYLNKKEGENEHVLLVVRFSQAVYAFEYPHASHSKVKNLIELLKQKLSAN